MPHTRQAGALWVAGDGFGAAGLALLATNEFSGVVHLTSDSASAPVDSAVEIVPLPQQVSDYGACCETAATLGKPTALVCSFITAAVEARLHECCDDLRCRVMWELDAYSLFSKSALNYLGTGAAIVNVVPACGLVPAKKQPLRSAASAAVIAATRAWALELAPRGIRVCAVAVGLTENLPESLGYTATGRVATPGDLYGLVRYLTGGGAELVNGACIPLDGGYTAGYCRNF